MTAFKSSTSVSIAFAEGKPKKQGVNQSVGDSLYYHGNKIAEWREDGLYISNGGYVTYSRSGTKIPGSKTTKDKLNALPGVRIYQEKCKWFLNGIEWFGQWVKIESAAIPNIDERKKGEIFVTQTKIVAIDGWRGRNEPIYAVAGANDTGTWSNSPCPSHIAEKEIKEIENELLKNGIKTIGTSGKTSNVFCGVHYLIPMLKHVEKAREIVKNYLQNHETHLAYVVE